MPQPSTSSPVTQLGTSEMAEVAAVVRVDNAPPSNANDPRERGAQSAIAGFLYQALVTLHHWCAITDGQELVLEGREDLEIRSAGGSDKLTVTPDILAQIKLSGRRSLNWGHEAIWKSALEFLCLYFGHGTDGQPPRLQLITNAAVGESTSGLVQQWKSYAWSPESEQRAFIAALRRKLASALSHDLSDDLRTRTGGILAGATDANLGQYAAAVEWSGGFPSPPELRQQIKASLRQIPQAATWNPDALIDYLLANILSISTEREMPARVVNAERLRGLITAGLPAAATWSNVGFQNLTERIEAVLVLQRGMAETLATSVSLQHESLRKQDHLEATIIDRVGRLETSLEQFISTTASVASDAVQLFEPLDGVEREVVRLLDDARCEDALARTLGALAKTKDGEPRFRLLFLKASCYAPMDHIQASASAREASQASHGGWRVILESLHLFYDGRDVNEPELLGITRDDTADDGMKNAAKLLLAEHFLVAGRNADATAIAAGRAGDTRFARVLLRGAIRSKQFLEAETLLNATLESNSAEHHRFSANLRLERLIADFQDGVLTKGMPEYGTRCQEVIERHRVAIERCNIQSKYRVAEMQSNMAMVMCWNGQVAEAEAHFRMAIRLRHETPEPHLGLASVLGAAKRIDDALFELETCIRLADSQRGSPLRCHARMLFAQAAVENNCNLERAMQRTTEAVQCATADERPAARWMQVRWLAAAGKLAEAEAAISAWPTDEGPLQRALAEVAILQIRGEHPQVIERVTALHERLAGEPPTSEVRITSDVLLALSYMHAGNVEESIAHALLVVDATDGAHASDLALEAARKSTTPQTIADVEDHLIAKHPDQVDALQSRVSRLIVAGLLSEAEPWLAKLARASGRAEDVVNHAKVLWNLQRRDAAADVLLPHADRMKSADDLVLLSELYACKGRRSDALRAALRAYALDKSNGQMAVLSLGRGIELSRYEEMPAELGLRIKEIYTAIDQGKIDKRWASRVPINPEELAKAARAHRLAREEIISEYTRGRYPIAWLAAMLQMPHTRAVNLVQSDPALTFWLGGPPANPLPSVVENIRKGTKIVLDLTSAILLADVGLLEPLSSKQRMSISAHQLADISAEEVIARDNLDAARRGVIFAITEHGRIAPDIPALEREAERVRGQCAAIKQWLDVIALPPLEDGPDSNRQMDCMLGLIDLAAKGGHLVVTADPIWDNVNIAPLSQLLQVKVALGEIGPELYCDSICDLIRKGCHRFSVSMWMFDRAFERDGGVLGENARAIVEHFRQPDWQRPGIVKLIKEAVLGRLEGRQRPVSDRTFGLLVCAILHGSSFNGNGRRDAFRHLIQWCSAAAQSNRLSTERSVRVTEIQGAISRAFRDGDPWKGPWRPPRSSA